MQICRGQQNKNFLKARILSSKLLIAFDLHIFLNPKKSNILLHLFSMWRRRCSFLLNSTPHSHLMHIFAWDLRMCLFKFHLLPNVSLQMPHWFTILRNNNWRGGRVNHSQPNCFVFRVCFRALFPDSNELSYFT